MSQIEYSTEHVQINLRTIPNARADTARRSAASIPCLKDIGSPRTKTITTAVLKPSNPIVLKAAMQQSDRRFDTGTMRALFDKGSVYWTTLAEHPAVAAALSNFPSEKDTRKTGRLDLVAWIHVISAFGVDGPSDAHWNQLFNACCFEAPHAPQDNLPYLRDPQVAVLLAYAKVTQDLPDNASHAHIIKQRIRPAVVGRPEARAPGIIQQVQRKFDSFVYTSVSSALVLGRIQNCRPDLVFATLVPDLLHPTNSTCSSTSLSNPHALHQHQQPRHCDNNNPSHPRSPNVLPWIMDDGDHGSGHDHDPVNDSPPFDFMLDSNSDSSDVLSPMTLDESSAFFGAQANPTPPTRNTADVVRDLARSVALIELKQWENIMIDFLNLDTTADASANARYANFLRESESVRVQFQEGLCSMFSLYLCEQLEATSARIPYDQS